MRELGRAGDEKVKAHFCSMPCQLGIWAGDEKPSRPLLSWALVTAVSWGAWALLGMASPLLQCLYGHHDMRFLSMARTKRKEAVMLLQV